MTRKDVLYFALAALLVLGGGYVIGLQNVAHFFAKAYVDNLGNDPLPGEKY